MGNFIDTVKKAMAHKNIRQVDLTSKRFTQPTIAALFRGIIPRKEELITHIAKVLDIPPKTLKVKAARDIISEKILDAFNLTWDDIAPDFIANPKTKSALPVYKLSAFKNAYTDNNGSPIGIKPSFMLTPSEKNIFFAIYIDTNELSPRIQIGETVEIVVSGPSEMSGEYCIVKTKDGEIYPGRVISNKKVLTIETIPYQIFYFEGKDVSFVYRIKTIHSNI